MYRNGMVRLPEQRLQHKTISKITKRDPEKPIIKKVFVVEFLLTQKRQCQLRFVASTPVKDDRVHKEMTKEKYDELNSIKYEIMDCGARKISSPGHNHEEKEYEVLFDCKMNSKQQHEHSHKKRETKSQDVQVRSLFIRKIKLEWQDFIRSSVCHSGSFTKESSSKWNRHREALME